LGKNYEEDFKFINKKDNVTNAIMSTIIPESLNYLKHSRMKNIKNSEALKNETEFTLNKNYNENKNINYFNNFLTNKALSAENRKTKKIKNKKNIKNDKIIQSFQNLEELFGSSNSENEQEEIIIDTVIHSDDETTLENKIIPKKSLSGTYLQEIQSKIPKINLDLIEFNKLKVFQEIDLYSLQRRNYKNMSVEDNINIIKKKIKKIKNKININSKKAEAMKKFIDDLKNKYILYKRIKTKSSAINSKVNYIANHEIIDLNQVEEKEEDDIDNDYGSDYLNENDEITE
jgi:hypothetical protein